MNFLVMDSKELITRNKRAPVRPLQSDIKKRYLSAEKKIIGITRTRERETLLSLEKLKPRGADRERAEQESAETSLSLLNVEKINPYAANSSRG